MAAPGGVVAAEFTAVLRRCRDTSLIQVAAVAEVPNPTEALDMQSPHLHLI